MDVRNCRRCGKIFKYIAGPMICPACKEEFERQFHVVKDFIRNNKEAGIADICEQCGVTENQIKQWIREERLVFGDDSPVGIDCEGCGATIKGGRYCEKCKLELSRGLMAATSQHDNSRDDGAIGRKHGDSPKMRFLN